MRTVLLLALTCLPALAADPGHFEGRLALELADGPGPASAWTLREPLDYVGADGRRWTAPRALRLDGDPVPGALRGLPDLPVAADYRRAAAIHAAVVQQRALPWREAHRLLHAASLDEGLSEPEARLLHLAVYAGGWRWQAPPSSCHGSCHAGNTVLAWRPAVDAARIAPLLAWALATSPTLEQVEQRVDAVLGTGAPHPIPGR